MIKRFIIKGRDVEKLRMKVFNLGSSHGLKVLPKLQSETELEVIVEGDETTIDGFHHSVKDNLFGKVEE